MYIGEHNHGLYALSSLVDKTTITISTELTKPLLIEGPTLETVDDSKTGQESNVHYKINDLNLHLTTPYLLLGHYKVPELITSWLPQITNNNLLKISDSNSQNANSIKLLNGDSHAKNEKDNENETHLKSVSVQTDDPIIVSFRLDMLYKRAYIWLHQQENKGLKVALIILVGLVITMFWHLRYQVRFY